MMLSSVGKFPTMSRSEKGAGFQDPHAAASEIPEHGVIAGLIDRAG